MKASILIATAATAALLAFGAQAAPTTVYNTELGPLTGTGTTTTSPTGTTSTNAANNLSNEAPAADEWQQRNVRQGGVVGVTTDYADNTGGNGSIYFKTDGTTPSKADMEYSFSQPLLLSDFAGGSYDWYKDSASGDDWAPAPAYRLMMADANGDYAGYLIYEPYRNHAVVEDAWQTELITSSSIFWSNNAKIFLPDPCPNRQSCQYSLGTLASLNTGAKVTGFSTGVGSGWSPGTFVGAVDNVSFTFDDNTSSFNFEVSAVPEPATWAMLIAGFGLAGAALRRRNRAVLAA